MAKMWAGRFSKEVDEKVNDFNSSVSFDARMYKQDIKGSIAHVMMLAKQGILNDIEKEQILAWIKKKNFRPSEATFEEKQKFCAFLYRKGFQIDTIRSVLSLDITSI